MDSSNDIKFMSIRDLCGKKFYIPKYQRGYRWDQQQVIDLLNDIHDFSQRKTTDKEIYCLQPLVVTQKEDNCYEVIDGQQRLTTIKILLSYLKHAENTYSLEYETRQQSENFLKQLGSLNSANAGQEGKTCDNESNESEENIDFCHMRGAWDTIDNWFKTNEVCEKCFAKILLENVKFIWYEVADDRKSVQVFTRLNIGKIPLTDAELIKALFLNESNFESNEEQQKQEIATEWEQIEYTLQNDEFWLFLNDVVWSKPTRIDFVLDLVREMDKLELKDAWKKNYIKTDEGKKCIGADEHQTFRYFYEYFKMFKENKNQSSEKKSIFDIFVDKVKSIFDIFVEWFRDWEIYHYVGFLRAIKAKSKINDLLSCWEEAKDKKEFCTNKLKKIIKDKLKDCNKLTTEYESSRKPQCYPLLLLFNIQTVIDQGLAIRDNEKFKLEMPKFPFHLFKKESQKASREGWEIEHIASNAGDDEEDPEHQKLYLLSVLPELQSNKGLTEKINAFLTDNKSNVFAKLEEEISSFLPERIPNDKLNCIWNFALLDSSTNEEYQNAPFPVKRLHILAKQRGIKASFTFDSSSDDKVKTGEDENQAGNAYVLPCTYAVFMKAYRKFPGAFHAWTIDDGRAYLLRMNEVLSKADFITDQKDDINNWLSEGKN